MLFPRMTSNTLAAPSERNIAAWPAELPLPAITTVSLTELTFHCRRSVVNAHILKLFAPLRIQPAVIGARCNQNSFCSKNGGAPLRLEADAVLAVGNVIKRKSLGWCRKFRAESVSLKLSEPGQFAATNAGWKSEEILNQRGGTSLSARGVTFQNNCVQSFGCRIHSGG